MDRIGEEDILRALGEVGIGQGDTLIAHSFLGAFGILEGGVESVIAAFDEAIGPSGTLILPTYTLSFLKGQAYDHERSPSEVGQLSEHFRNLPDVTRTFQPLYSHAIRGPKLRYYAENTSLNGLGPDSLFERLRHDDAQILFFGCPMDAATFIHYVEQSLKAPYRFLKTFKGEAIREGKSAACEIQHYARYLDAGVVNDFSRFENKVKKNGTARVASLGRGELICLRAQAFYEQAAKAFGEDQFCFLKGPVDLGALGKEGEGA